MIKNFDQTSVPGTAASPEGFGTSAGGLVTPPVVPLPGPLAEGDIDSLFDVVPREKLPRHVAIIMDGNGRWAQRQGLPRIEGHRRGTETVRRTVEACCQLGLEQLTLYCLSSENWKRPAAELDFLMKLLEQYVIDQRPEILRQNIRFTTIGRRDGIPASALREIDTSAQLTRDNTGLRLCLAINYGGRQELVSACRSLAEKVQRGELTPEQVDEQAVSNHLHTAGHPDPDLLIRTAGELRVSNFLLWQISYSEIWVTERCWPEFRVQDLKQALIAYAGRVRRFGGLKREAGA